MIQLDIIRKGLTHPPPLLSPLITVTRSREWGRRSVPKVRVWARMMRKRSGVARKDCRARERGCTRSWDLGERVSKNREGKASGRWEESRENSVNKTRFGFSPVCAAYYSFYDFLPLCEKPLPKFRGSQVRHPSAAPEKSLINILEFSIIKHREVKLSKRIIQISYRKYCVLLPSSLSTFRPYLLQI